MRVLLVEDHLQLAESVAQALKSTGLTVDVLHDGVAADLALSSEEYAAAILDVGLPRMDGFEVLARLRARGKNLPVLMLTARSDVKDRVHGLNLGADDYLAKPFELTELEALGLHLLEHMTQQNAAVSTLELRVGVGKVLANIAQRGGAKQGVAQRMQQYVAIRMREQTRGVRNPHAAQGNEVAFSKTMHIVAMANTNKKTP